MNLFEQVLQFFSKLVGSACELLWGDLIRLEFNEGKVVFALPLLVLILVPAGIYFTVKSRFLQFRLFPEMVKATLKKKASGDKNSIEH